MQLLLPRITLLLQGIADFLMHFASQNAGKPYLLGKVFLILLAIDSVYLYATGAIFGSVVQQIQHSALSVRYGAAFIVYALLAYGLVHFCHHNKKFNIKDAAILGAIVYGVFDFTNYAMFKNYGLPIALMDTAWGSVLMAATAFIANNI